MLAFCQNMLYFYNAIQLNMKNINPLSVTLPPVHPALTGSPLLSGEVFFMEQEIWKELFGYDYRYQISNLGRVKKITNKKTVILKNTIGGAGYYKVQLRKNNKQQVNLVHRLIAINFIPNPENKPEVNHKNGIKTDISIDNLEWNTCSENKYHAYKNKLINHPKGLTHHNCKFTEEDVLNIRKIGNLLTNKQIAEMFSVSEETIWNIKNRKTWVHI